MDSESSYYSSSLSEESSETFISDVQYIPFADIVSSDEEPHPEKFVRLMSLDFGKLDRSFSSTDAEETYLANCFQYWDIVSVAEKLVDDVIDEAEGINNCIEVRYLSAIFSVLGVVNKHIEETPSKTISTERIVRRYSEDYPIIEYNRPKFTGWPIIGHFTIELGADKIDEYLASFNTNEEWMYIIYYLGVKTDYPSKYYEYQAMWSLPSPEYPIAQATASVFFTIEVSEVLPPECLVDVTFVFENHQLKRKPGLTDFSEEFLNYILDSKIAVFRKIRF